MSLDPFPDKRLIALRNSKQDIGAILIVVSAASDRLGVEDTRYTTRTAMRRPENSGHQIGVAHGSSESTTL